MSSEVRIREFLDQVDADHDGRVTVRELLQFAQQHPQNIDYDTLKEKVSSNQTMILEEKS